MRFSAVAKLSWYCRAPNIRDEQEKDEFQKQNKHVTTLDAKGSKPAVCLCALSVPFFSAGALDNFQSPWVEDLFVSGHASLPECANRRIWQDISCTSV